MREPIKARWPKKSNCVLKTYRNFIMCKKNLAVRWWYDEVTIGEAEQSLDLKEANTSLIYTNWLHYNVTKGWFV